MTLKVISNIATILMNWSTYS